jgi:Flp pilus assembly pilin Flp
VNAKTNSIPIARGLRCKGALSRHCAGQALVEYALVLAFISVVAVSVLMYMGVQINGVYQTIIDALDRVRVAI